MKIKMFLQYEKSQKNLDNLKWFKNSIRFSRMILLCFSRNCQKTCNGCIQISKHLARRHLMALFKVNKVYKIDSIMIIKKGPVAQKILNYH